MSARHADDQLLALLEQRLPPADRARVEAHLAECARCRLAARDLADLTQGLEALPGALRGLPRRAAQQWPAVWARVSGARPTRRLWPQVSVYLGVVTSFMAVIAVFPGGNQGVPASVTAGMAAGPQNTQPATVAFHTDDVAQGTGLAGVAEAAPTQVGTEPVLAIPVPTPVPGP